MFETKDGTSVIYVKYGIIEAGRRSVFTRRDSDGKPIGKTFVAKVRKDARGALYVMSAGRRHYYAKKNA